MEGNKRPGRKFYLGAEWRNYFGQKNHWKPFFFFFFWLPKPKVTRSTWSAHPCPLLVSVDFFGGPRSTGDEISVAVTAQMPLGVLVVKTVVTLQKNNSAQQPCNFSIAQAALGTIRHAGSGEQTTAQHTHSLCHSFPVHHLKLSSAFLQNLLAGLCQPPPLAHGQPLSPAPLAHPLLISHVKYFSECSYSDASCSASLPIARPKFLLESLNTKPCFAPLCQWSHWSFGGQQVGEWSPGIIFTHFTHLHPVFYLLFCFCSSFTCWAAGGRSNRTFVFRAQPLLSQWPTTVDEVLGWQKKSPVTVCLNFASLQ